MVTNIFTLKLLYDMKVLSVKYDLFPYSLKIAENIWGFFIFLGSIEESSGMKWVIKVWHDERVTVSCESFEQTFFPNWCVLLLFKISVDFC